MSSPKNIILIVLDTLRADAISVYNNQIETPSIEKLSKECLVFERNIASAPWTLPSHASMFTGRYPMEHHVHFKGDNRDFLKTSWLMNDYPGKTIAEILKQEGYTTIGMSANTGIVPGTGFDRGFDVFSFFDPMGNFALNNEWSVLKGKIIERFGETKSEVFKNFLSKGIRKENISFLNTYFKLRKRIRKSHEYNNFPYNKSGRNMINSLSSSSLSQPFFLFLNLMESHEPYIDDFSPQQEQEYSLGLLEPSIKTVKKVRESYYAESKLIDWEIAEIVRFLKENNIYDSTNIIITSDHGQSLFEHEFYGHGIYLHDELIRVPLLIKKAVKDPHHETMNNLFSNTGLFEIMKGIGVENEFRIPDYQFVLSEADGSWRVPNSIIRDNKEAMRRLSVMDSPRKAVFRDDFKLVLNMDNGNVESFEKNGNTLEEDQFITERKELVETIELMGHD